MTEHRFTLSFKLIECQGCGVSRIRGVLCADCGARPHAWEVDPELQRRQSLVQALMLTLATPPTPRAPTTVFDFVQDQIFDRIGSWLSEFLGSLAVAVESKYRDTEALRNSVSEFTKLDSSIRSGAPTRPFTHPHAAALMMIDLGRSMVEEYLSALQASTPIGAQQHAATAQSRLDQLADCSFELSIWLDRFQAMAAPGEIDEILGALIADAMVQSDTGDLIAMDAFFRRRLEGITGVEIEPGLGVTYATFCSLASVYFNEGRFNSTLAGYTDLLHRNTERSAAIITNSTFADDIKRVELELFDSAIACQRILTDTRLARQAARAIIELHGTLVESAGLIVCSSILVATGRKTAPYESLRRKNATELLTSAQSQPDLAPLLLGLDTHLRTAQAHRAITYHDDHIATDIKSGQREVTFDELVDTTYTAIESLLAALLAIRIAASTMDVEFDDSFRLQMLGMTTPEIAEFTLRSFGHACRVSLQSDTELLVELEGPGPEGITPALGALTSHLDQQSLTLILQVPGRAELRCPFSAYRTFRAETNDFGKQLALMRIQASWTEPGGQRHLNMAQLRKWSAYQASAITEEELGPQVRRLRTLREFAREFGDEELADVLTSLIRTRRLESTQTAPQQSEISAVQTIIDWGEASIEFDLI